MRGLSFEKLNIGCLDREAPNTVEGKGITLKTGEEVEIHTLNAEIPKLSTSYDVSSQAGDWKSSSSHDPLKSKDLKILTLGMSYGHTPYSPDRSLYKRNHRQRTLSKHTKLLINF